MFDSLKIYSKKNKKPVWNKISVDCHWQFHVMISKSLKFLYVCIVPHMVAHLTMNTDTSKETWGRNPALTIHYCSSTLRDAKTFSTEYKKRMFSQGRSCHILKEYRDSRLIMFSINCFILLENVPPYAESVFPSILQHVRSCKSF